MDPAEVDESGKSPERLKIEAALREQGWTEDGPHWRTPTVEGRPTKIMPYPEAARAVDWYAKDKP